MKSSIDFVERKSKLLSSINSKKSPITIDSAKKRNYMRASSQTFSNQKNVQKAQFLANKTKTYDEYQFQGINRKKTQPKSVIMNSVYKSNKSKNLVNSFHSRVQKIEIPSYVKFGEGKGRERSRRRANNLKLTKSHHKKENSAR